MNHGGTKIQVYNLAHSDATFDKHKLRFASCAQCVGWVCAVVLNEKSTSSTLRAWFLSWSATGFDEYAFPFSGFHVDPNNHQSRSLWDRHRRSLWHWVGWKGCATPCALRIAKGHCTFRVVEIVLHLYGFLHFFWAGRLPFWCSACHQVTLTTCWL